jgi:hypothetical protein
MATPTKATETVAHVAVGAAAAYVVPKVIGKGKGIGVVVAAAVIAVLLHMMLDAPFAKAMAASGIQL